MTNQTPDPTTETGMFVITEMDDDGKYHLSLKINGRPEGSPASAESAEDVDLALDRNRARDYGMAVLDAITQAEYDAAVFKQITDLVGEQAAGRDAVVALRELRLPMTFDRIEIKTVLNGKPGEPEPFLHFYIDGVAAFELDIPAAREHAVHVLEGVSTMVLDTDYYGYLIDVVGAEDGPASAAVHFLSKFR